MDVIESKEEYAVVITIRLSGNELGQLKSELDMNKPFLLNSTPNIHDVINALVKD